MLRATYMDLPTFYSVMVLIFQNLKKYKLHDLSVLNYCKTNLLVPSHFNVGQMYIFTIMVKCTIAQMHDC